ncbi:Plant invertase/pectin methylesterase inhibitor superfamily protein [Euphorbia peplus]|nr:Plant invertase/pectin methylesterase inhibitor superfamily protein [Euphorbia peplus]
MSNPTLLLSSSLLLLLLISLSGHPNPAVSAGTRRRTNIKNICKSTSYPTLCTQYLTILPNSSTKPPQSLAKSAILASLYRAQFTRLHILKVSRKLRVQDRRVSADCLELLGDSVDSLCKSILEISKVKKGGKFESDYSGCDVRCHVRNVQTYLSSALTDASDCADEFDEFVKRKKMGKMIAEVKVKAINVEQITSVALDLFCQFVADCD